MYMVDPGAGSYYSVFGLPPDAGFVEIRDARDRLARETAARLAAARDPEEKKAIEKRQQELNAIMEVLARPANREQYDREHPEARVLWLKSAAAPLFADPAERWWVLYRAARRFLAEKGVPVDPLCDLDAEDFSADFTSVELLEKMLEEAAHG